MPNRSNVKIKEGLAQVIGRDPRSILYVLASLICVSWIIDLSLELLKEVYLLKFQQEWVFNLVFFIISALGLFVLFKIARKTLHSEPYQVDDEDSNKNKRETLILPLSNYSDKSSKNRGVDVKNAFTLADFKHQMGNFNPEIEFSELWKSEFNCNWLMTLNAIRHYPNVTKVILLSTKNETKTDGQEKEDSGSFHQVETFKQFVNSYFQNKVRNIEVVTHLDFNWIRERVADIETKIQKGIPSDDPLIFAETCLNIMDNLEKEKQAKEPNYLQEKLVIDVTGGKASMSASLAAVSGSKGIFLHYTDTHSKESHTLDINSH